MKTYKIKLKSTSPYMQHRMDDSTLEQWEKQRGVIHERPGIDEIDNKKAEFHCHRNEEGKCYIPSDHIKGALINAASSIKAKVGTRSKSMKPTVAGCFSIFPEQILLPDFDQIDKRSAVNRNIKGRVITVRPKWSKWEIELILKVSEDSILKEIIKNIFLIAGQQVGIGSYRPTNSGPFGCFEIIKIEDL